jgi:ABC-type multidrug transport system permease subunit
VQSFCLLCPALINLSMKYLRYALVGASVLILLYLFVFTDASFSGENSLAWISLVVLSVATYGLDFWVIRRNRRRGE